MLRVGSAPVDRDLIDADHVRRDGRVVLPADLDHEFGTLGVERDQLAVGQLPPDHQDAVEPEHQQGADAGEESEEGGAIRGESGRMLLELFEFGDLTAREAMVPRVKVGGIPLGASAADVRTLDDNVHAGG